MEEEGIAEMARGRRSRTHGRRKVGSEGQKIKDSREKEGGQ